MPLWPENVAQTPQSNYCRPSALPLSPARDVLREAAVRPVAAVPQVGRFRRPAEPAQPASVAAADRQDSDFERSYAPRPGL